jgi:hypothetical protein
LAAEPESDDFELDESDFELDVPSPDAFDELESPDELDDPDDPDSEDVLAVSLLADFFDDDARLSVR